VEGGAFMMSPMVLEQVWQLPGAGMVTPEARIHKTLPLILIPKLAIPLLSALSSTSTDVLTGKITVFSIIFHLLWVEIQFFVHSL
jgi:hypothetical protein